MKSSEFITEAPLPGDWDTKVFTKPAPFKDRVKYAVDRAERLGTGSSRVVVTIEFEGRQTALKIAKNRKGLAQNKVEVDILRDDYIQQTGITVPLIDFEVDDKGNTVWLQTEVAQKATEKQLCQLMKCHQLHYLIEYAGLSTMRANTVVQKQRIIDRLETVWKTEDDSDTFYEYAGALSTLQQDFDLKIVDFNNPFNWGIYQGRPVVIDLGFTGTVYDQHYS